MDCETTDMEIAKRKAADLINDSLRRMNSGEPMKEGFSFLAALRDKYINSNSEAMY